MNTPSVSIVGIGSAHGDDQAGWLVAQQLATKVGEARARVRQAKSPIELLEWLHGVDHLIVCDCSQGAWRPGQMRRWTWPAEELEEITCSGTHDLALPTVLKLAEQLGRLPEDITIWTIEGASAEALADVTDEVAAAIPHLADRIRDELQS